jgi:dihydroorotate dehydrogenase
MAIKLNIPFKYTKPLFHAMDPETAHRASICAMKNGLHPCYDTVKDDRLKITLWNRTFFNPVGLAAGFDKNAEVMGPMLQMGFGFVEVGTVTPKPQIGNPRPRIFRDVKNEAVINRMGFPNKGLLTFKENIQKFSAQENRPAGIIGLNIGMNKDQTDPAADYCYLIRELGAYADYFTINISSPNTPGLRNLQSRENLLPLLERVKEERRLTCNQNNLPPLLVKLAPDLDEEQQEELAQAALDGDIDGLILTNTTLERPEFLPEEFRSQMGGLSGKPLTQKSTAIIRNFYYLTKGKIPIIGAGGISNAEDAYDKIKAGASLIQLYSALVYHGPELAHQINKDLLTFLKRDGFKSITEATGTEKTKEQKCA